MELCPEGDTSYFTRAKRKKGGFFRPQLTESMRP